MGNRERIVSKTSADSLFEDFALRQGDGERRDRVLLDLDYWALFQQYVDRSA